MPLNLASREWAQVDAFVTNGHKWLYTCRGCAVMWTRHSDILPIITSSATVLPEFSEERCEASPQLVPLVDTLPLGCIFLRVEHYLAHTPRASRAGLGFSSLFYDVFYCTMLYYALPLCIVTRFTYRVASDTGWSDLFSFLVFGDGSFFVSAPPFLKYKYRK
jgi:hypothetical protein